MLLHGWPESWYSWRHQLTYLSTHGYSTCAPDMRGYGGTEAPSDLKSYNIHALALDIVSIASSLGHEQFVVVGHDFGAYLAWRVALLHPTRVVAVCGMSVPFVGVKSPKTCGPLENLQQRYGWSLAETIAGDVLPREERLKARYQYMLHHCLPGAAEMYDQNVEEALYRLYAYHPGVDCHDGPEVVDKKMFKLPPHGAEDVSLDARVAPGCWLRIPKPMRLPSWLSQIDLDYYIREFKGAGFAGGLNWYRSLDINWEATRRLGRESIDVPSLFIAGDEDAVIRAHGGAEFVRNRMSRTCRNLRGFILLQGAGHWVQQEEPDKVNACLLKFLEETLRFSKNGNFERSKL